MRELLEIYKQSLEQLRQRHEQLTAKRHQYDKRVALLEEEMDEIEEAMCMMRAYLEV